METPRCTPPQPLGPVSAEPNYEVVAKFINNSKHMLVVFIPSKFLHFIAFVSLNYCNTKLVSWNSNWGIRQYLVTFPSSIISA